MRDKNEYEEFLTPGLVMCDQQACAFHTGSEIVCLRLEPHAHDALCPASCSRTRVVSKVLDIELVLVQTIEKQLSDKSLRLTEYELLVTSIESTPLTVHAFVNAVLCDKLRSEVVADFAVSWSIADDKHSVDHYVDETEVDGEKENRSARPTKPSERAYKVLAELIAARKTSGLYCLDNMQFVECQLSVNSLDSPTDNISISLATHNCNIVHQV